ncbi:MAG TPA: hypothetical protein VI916_03100 [Acidimicrobiia bacterium]|nr:hypothetical protein [Acidimicrobiia bacterium]
MDAEPEPPSEPVPPRTSRLLRRLVVALLALIAVLLCLVVLQLRRLTIEQKRTTCYARLLFLPDGFEDHPQYDALAATAARTHCEGDNPLIEFGG